MPDPTDLPFLPGELTGRALTKWLRTDGAGIFQAFGTGADALNFVRELGIDIASSTFYNVRRQVLNVVKSSDPLFSYPGDELIPYKWHVTDHGLDLSSDYQYRIHLLGADPESGILKDQWMTVASNRQLTINEVQDVARSYAGEGGVSGEIFDFVFGEIEPMRR